jgi:hypothetical protein
MTMAKTVPNFGQIAMAARRGWKWVDQLRLFVRITVTMGFHKVEIQTPTFKPEVSPPMTNMGPDWQMQEGIIAMIPALNKYMGRQQPHVFFIDDDGLEVAESKITSAPIPAGQYDAGQIIDLGKTETPVPSKSMARRIAGQKYEKPDTPPIAAVSKDPAPEVETPKVGDPEANQSPVIEET